MPHPVPRLTAHAVAVDAQLAPLWPRLPIRSRPRPRLRQAKDRLPASGQLDVNLRQQLGVQQCTMLDALAPIDAKPSAQGIKTVLGARVPRPRQDQSVDHSAQANGIARAALQLMIEEAEIEAGIVCNERRVTNEFQQLLDLSPKSGACRTEKSSDSPCTASASLGMERSGLK